MSNVTQAVILAAGVGSRLKSLTQHTPKALMPIAGEAAIERVVRQLVGQGIHDIAINIHHHAGQIRQHLGDGSRYNARFYYSHEQKLLDSGGGVRTAMDLLPHEGLIAVHNADILTAIPLQPLAALCPHQGCALALVPNPKHHSQGDFGFQNHQITFNTTAKHTFSGVSVWHPAALLSYESEVSFSLVASMKKLIQQQRCAGLMHMDAWFDIGRHRDLIQANRHFLND